MNRFSLVVWVLIIVLGCAEEESTTAQVATPPPVSTEFDALLENLAYMAPEASLASLEAFLDTHGHYTIADTVRLEIDRMRDAAEGRYRDARELARQGEFAEAEQVLNDLATYLADTRDGESAAQHLAFDFYFGKAQWLMIRQRTEEAELVARSLLDRDLTSSQNDQVEMILDTASNVGAALSQAQRMQARSGCRQVVIALETLGVEEGQYPTRFSLADAERWGSISALSAIEEYRTSADGYSFVGVSANGLHRIRVVDGMIGD